MSETEFKVTFRGEYVTGYMNDDGELVFHSPYDGSDCKFVGNPYRDTEIQYLKEKEADFDFLLETIEKVKIEPHLEYWKGDCNRRVTIDNKFATLEEVVLIINPLE